MVNLADVFRLQLAQQATLYNLTYNYGRRESAARVERFFFRMLEILPVTHTLEIGAHEATFSKNIAKSPGKIKSIRAFEANPYVYTYFILDKELQNSGVEYLHSAIGNSEGIWPFQIYDKIASKKVAIDSRRQSCFKRADCKENPSSIISVPITRIDTICADDPKDSLYAIWIDAEGFGREVLLGSLKTLQRTAMIYMELESARHFQNQALDDEIINLLLENDFVPILRDFLFPHQYNVIFVNKPFMASIEQEWHRYFQAVLRNELSASFGLPLIPQQNIKRKPPQNLHHKAESVEELREIMQNLPLLRAPRDIINPLETVVICHFDEIDDAIVYYGKKYETLPSFFVVTDFPEQLAMKNLPPNVVIRDYAELNQGMDIQLYFKPNRLPGKTLFACLVQKLQEVGINRYYIESRSMQDFYLRNSHVAYSEKEWKTILEFYNRLSDSPSQYAYLAICKARMEGEPGYIPLAQFPQYQHPHVQAALGDKIIEGGCSPVYEPGLGTENNTANFLKALEGAGQIWCFEPVKDTCQELGEEFKNEKCIEMVNCALWSKTGKLELIGSGASAYTQLSDNGQCDCIDIDSFIRDRQRPTLIKLDVEGAELEVLKGARKLISEFLPKLMISIYHSRPNRDWITLPRYLLDMNTDYEYYCAHHRPWFNESVLYAKPGNDSSS